MDAARYWASGGKISRKEAEAALRAQAEALGMESDALLALLGDEDDDEPDAFELHEDVREAVECFLCCCTQWRTAPNGRYLALDYAALAASMVMLNVKDTRAAFLDVRVMEQAALEELNRG